MSEHLHICRGTNRRFQARVRLPGRRRYILIGRPSTSQRVALRHLADAFAKNIYKRGDVLMLADYYDPISVVEMVR